MQERHLTALAIVLLWALLMTFVVLNCATVERILAVSPNQVVTVERKGGER